MYGDRQIGQRTAADYVTAARQWAKALKLLDPSICLVSCGQTGVDDWDRVVIDGLAPFVDLHSIHLYTGSSDYWSQRPGPPLLPANPPCDRSSDRQGAIPAAD